MPPESCAPPPRPGHSAKAASPPPSPSTPPSAPPLSASPSSHPASGAATPADAATAAAGAAPPEDDGQRQRQGRNGDCNDNDNDNDNGSGEGEGEGSADGSGGWRQLCAHPEFRRGLRDMGGAALGLAAWGLVTGVAMTKAAGVLPALLMSLFVFAGTAQLAAAPLIASDAPMWVVWATALCLNLRFVLYSVQWRSYFGHLPLGQRARIAYWAADLNLVYFLRRWPQPTPQPGQQAYFWGGVLMAAGPWHLLSLLGIAAAAHIPESWGLGFAGTLALLGVGISLMTQQLLTGGLCALSGGLAAVLAYGLPLKLNMLVGIAAAVAAGTLIDRGLRRKPAPTPSRKNTP